MSEDNAPAEKKTHQITITIIDSHYEKLNDLVKADAKRDAKKPVTDEERNAIALKAFKKGLAKADIKRVPTVTWD